MSFSALMGGRAVQEMTLGGPLIPSMRFSALMGGRAGLQARVEGTKNDGLQPWWK